MGKGTSGLGLGVRGLLKFDGVNWTVYNTSNSGLPGNYVQAIAIDEGGNKWIGTDGGLAKFDGVNWTVYKTSNSGLPSNWVTSIAIDGQGNKWIGTGGRAYCIS
jgi:ligand-binding sensor domain-containing protein